MLRFEQVDIGIGSGKKTQQVVRNLSFNLEAGKVLAIVGESGSGKSVSALSTFSLTPQARILSGEIQMHYKGVTQLLNKAGKQAIRSLLREAVGFVFQEPLSALNPLMRCGEQVEERIARTEQARERVLEMFRKVRLPEPERIYHSWPHELSGGQRQRVMIAMALIHQPALIIADEPTTALDASVQMEVVHLLKQLVKEAGCSMIFISHDLRIVQQLADDVLVMYRGEALEYQSAKQLFSHAEHPYTKALLEVRPGPENKGHFLPVLGDYTKDNTANPLGKEKLQPWSVGDNTLRESILDVVRLRVQYGQKLVLKNIDLQLFKGEALGVLGESGSGKSTLAKAVSKLCEYEGDILLGGKDIRQILNAYPKKVQLIFQDPFSSLNPRKSCGATLEEVLKVHFPALNAQERKDRVIQLLEEVGLQASDADKYPHAFSGGQRQRICIARALAAEAELLICDESVSALDVSVQAQILNLLKKLQLEKGLSLLFISHDIGVVAWFCDRIAVLNQGEIVELEEAVKLMRHPKDLYTQMLLKASGF